MAAAEQKGMFRSSLFYHLRNIKQRGGCYG